MIRGKNYEVFYIFLTEVYHILIPTMKDKSINNVGVICIISCATSN